MTGRPDEGPVLDVPAVADVEAAARRIASHVRHTPVVTSRGLDRRVGAEIAFKCENLQRAGAFKFRGAWNAVLSLPDNRAASGVCTHSSGNHGAAVALAARLRSIPAIVVMPAGAPTVKRRAVESFGAEIIECEPTLAAREATLAAVVGERGGRVIHPYDDFHVISGQGTVALELLDEPSPAPWCEPPTGPPDAIVVPVGGGGLLGGSALVAATRGCRIYGAEPAGADDAMRSLRAGRIIPVEAPDTIADGLRTSLGERNFAIIRRRVEDILTVSEDSIRAAMRLLWERTKLVVEPSGAVPLAALIEHGPPRGCSRIAVLLSGGNVDLDAVRF
ncbi:MAG: pyridoxal-phosphate dependent enzyme [Immundisolibacterales bacterium]|nr:pyridoxal-phosphate dependent enzyme [Immundisolibacterales bacterium]